MCIVGDEEENQYLGVLDLCFFNLHLRVWSEALVPILQRNPNLATIGIGIDFDDDEAIDFESFFISLFARKLKGL